MVQATARMYCKDDLRVWFQNLSPHKRIDFMCGMLHMCLPMELRFIGSFVEDLAKKDFHQLRESEVKVNSRQELSNFAETDEKIFRYKMAIYLALLHSSNRTCSHLVFNLLETYLTSALTVTESLDKMAIENILLVLSMAMNHPAFTHHQRTKMYEQYNRAEETADNIYRKQSEAEFHARLMSQRSQQTYDVHYCDQRLASPAGSPRPVKVGSPGTRKKVHIVDVELAESRTREQRDKKQIEFRLQVRWSNGVVTEVFKTYQELHDFHLKLSKLFPEEANVPKHERKLPHLVLPRPVLTTLYERLPLSGPEPSLVGISGPMEETAREHIVNYTRSLVTLPQHLLEHEHISNFFSGTHSMARNSLDAASHQRSHQSINQQVSTLPISGDDESVIPYCAAKSLTVYNSHLAQAGQPGSLSPRSPTHCGNNTLCNSTDMRLGNPVNHISPMAMSPSHSPPSSPDDSPINSRSTSPGGRSVDAAPTQPPDIPTLPDVLRELQLEKYSDVLEKIPPEKLSVISYEELEKLGLPKDVIPNLKRAWQGSLPREKFYSLPPNGIIDPTQLPHPPTVAWHSPAPHPHPQYPPHGMPRVVPMFIPVLYQGRGDANSEDSNCDLSSPSQSPKPCVKGMSDSSDEETKKDKQEMQDTIKSTGKRKPIQHSVLTHSKSSPQELTETQREEVETSSHSHVNANHRGDMPINSYGGTGYASDPGCQKPPVQNKPPYKAQPAHMNTGYSIQMQENYTVKANGHMLPMGVGPQLRESVMTTSVVNASVNALPAHGGQMDAALRPVVYMVPPNGPAALFSNARHPGRNLNCTAPHNNGAFNHSGSSGSISIPNLNNGSKKVLNPSGLLAVSHRATCGDGHQSSHTSPEMFAQPLVPSSAPTLVSTSVTYSSSTLGNPTCRSPSSVPSCSSCGCPGHSGSATYPYMNPPMQWPIPFIAPTSNGVVPIPHNFYLPPAAHFPNGLNHPEVVYGPHHLYHNLTHANGPASTVIPSVQNNLFGYSSYSVPSTPHQGHSSVNSAPVVVKSKKINCHNCGSSAHLASACTETSMEAISGNYHLTYQPKNDSD